MPPAPPRNPDRPGAIRSFGRRLAALALLAGCTAHPVTGSAPQHANRLLAEKSPYLLQHAHNPVDWYPWGTAALAKARRDSKPIFLSIGYSTCHWCHVMERESFEDPSVAALLNAHFVAIKVDREERPDLDAVYMQAVMQMTGQGGWPLTVFLTPDLKPFYGGTYFPPEERWGRPGLKQVLTSVAAAWKEQPDRLRAAGDSLTHALQEEASRLASAGVAANGIEPASRGQPPLPAPVLAAGLRQFTDSFDAERGGFDAAPKFPRPHALSFLLRAWQRRPDPAVLAMVEHTLQAMAAGGMYDQLGGGFHRYSTDVRWRVPHFEKMLYDQALLATTYLEAYQATGRAEYAVVARETFEYVLRDLTSSEGAFYSAEDADSAEDPAHPAEKREGACYLWTPAQLEQVVGAGDAAVIAYLYGVEPGGNAPDDPTGEFQGKNVLYRAHTPAEAAQRFARSESEIASLVARARPRLLAARRARPRPHLDDKVLTDWNGLMIAAFAVGARVLEEPRYEAAARRAADVLRARLIRADGRLLHRYREGDAAILGTLDDYAFLIHGLIELYQTTFEPRDLAEAVRLTQAMLDLFWDDAAGGLFLTGRDAEALLVRQKVLYDGAIPSGNSVAALDLLRLGRMTGTAAWESKAQALCRAFAGMVTQHPTGYPQLLIALAFAVGPSQEIVLAGPPDDAALRAMRRVVRQAFVPNAVVVLHPPGAAGAAIEALVPWVAPQGMIRGAPASYVCQSHACRQPVTTAEALKAQLTG